MNRSFSTAYEEIYRLLPALTTTQLSWLYAHLEEVIRCREMDERYATQLREIAEEYRKERRYGS